MRGSKRNLCRRERRLSFLVPKKHPESGHHVPMLDVDPGHHTRHLLPTDLEWMAVTGSGFRIEHQPDTVALVLVDDDRGRFGLAAGDCGGYRQSDGSHGHGAKEHLPSSKRQRTTRRAARCAACESRERQLPAPAVMAAGAAAVDPPTAWRFLTT